MEQKPTIIPVLLGPTAVGKSALALEVAARHTCEIISCDSRQIYKGLSIGTAKPSLEEQKRVPHHVVDILSPLEEYSAARWASDATKAIKQVLEKGKIPLICGGTFFYLQALVEGLSPTVEPDPSFRVRCKEEEHHSPGILHQRLALINPTRAAQLHPHDIQRVIRALHATTYAISSSDEKLPSPYQFFNIKISREREDLYARINKRVEHMFDGGLMEEFRGLLAQGYTEDLPGMKCVGYQELFKYIEGKASLNEVLHEIQQHSRKYAKRQTTWLRNKEQGSEEIFATGKSFDKVLDEVQEKFRSVGIC